MKVCGKCGAQCMDNQIYCHSCGAALDEKKGAASKATDAVKDFGQDYKAYTDNYFGEKNNYRNGLEKFYKAHGGLIIGIIALLIWANWGSLGDFLGLALGILGIYVCKFEESSTIKIIAYICNGLAVGLSILCLLSL